MIDMLQRIIQAPIVRCDAIPWAFAGVSIAEISSGSGASGVASSVKTPGRC